MRLIFIVAALAIAGIVTWYVSGKMKPQQVIVEKPVEVMREFVAPREIPKTKVLVAARPIKVGQLVQPRDLEFQDWPQELVRREYKTEQIAKIEDYVGAVPIVEITTGEPILDGKLVKPGDKGFLAAVLRPGMKGVTFAVDRRSSVAGFVFPGDIIDVMISSRVEDRTRAIIATADFYNQQSNQGGAGRGGQNQNIRLEFPAEHVTETIIRDVKVLAVGGLIGRPETAFNNVETVTVELTPKLAEIIVNAQQFAKLEIALNPLRRTQEELARIEEQGDVYPYLVAGVDTGDYSFTLESETSPRKKLTLEAGDSRQSGLSNIVSIFRSGAQSDVFVRPVQSAKHENATSNSKIGNSAIGGVSVAPSGAPAPVTPPVFDSEVQ